MAGAPSTREDLREYLHSHSNQAKLKEDPTERNSLYKTVLSVAEKLLNEQRSSPNPQLENEIDEMISSMYIDMTQGSFQSSTEPMHYIHKARSSYQRIIERVDELVRSDRMPSEQEEGILTKRIVAYMGMSSCSFLAAQVRINYGEPLQAREELQQAYEEMRTLLASDFELREYADQSMEFLQNMNSTLGTHVALKDIAMQNTGQLERILVNIMKDELSRRPFTSASYH